MKWIGKHIFDLKTTFKEDVVIEKTITTSGGGSVGTTDLTATTATDQITINSSSGDNVIIGEASASIAGLMTTTHHDKLDGIESSADVTDATNVTAAGALMDSELTDLAGVKGVTISNLQPIPSEGAFANGDKTKLDAIEVSADVTDTTNVTSAGALMDSELTTIAAVKGLTANGAIDWTQSGAGTIHTDNYIENVVQTTVTGSSGSCTGNAATATTAATVTGATQAAITSIGADGDTLNILADDVIMTNSTGYKTQLSLINTTDNATCPVLLFRNDRDGSGLSDNDILGIMYFDGDDVAGETETYVYIEARAIETANGDECGSFKIDVANNGDTSNGISIQGNKDTAGEINADIGYGDTCVVETPGVFEAKGFHTNQVTLTATNNGSSPGGTAIPAGYSVIEVAAGSAATDKLTLPPAVQGSSLRIINADATAFELETSNPSTIFINGGTGGTGHSSTISGWSYVDCVCFGTNRWTCTKTTSSGVQTAVEASH